MLILVLPVTTIVVALVGFYVWHRQLVRKRGQYELPAYGGLLDRLYIPVERLKRHGNAFDELERAAINVEVHFGSELAEQLREPLRAYHRIEVATTCRMSNVGRAAEAKVSRALVRQWEDVVHAGTTAPDDADQLSLEMDDAKWALESTLRPFVEAPTFGEFLFMRKLLQAATRCAGRFATLFSRPGHGRIAVYAATPLTESTRGDA